MRARDPAAGAWPASALHPARSRTGLILIWGECHCPSYWREGDREAKREAKREAANVDEGQPVGGRDEGKLSDSSIIRQLEAGLGPGHALSPHLFTNAHRSVSVLARIGRLAGGLAPSLGPAACPQSGEAEH
jgi:hypothetical protein